MPAGAQTPPPSSPQAPSGALGAYTGGIDGALPADAAAAARAKAQANVEAASKEKAEAEAAFKAYADATAKAKADADAMSTPKPSPPSPAAKARAKQEAEAKVSGWRVRYQTDRSLTTSIQLRSSASVSQCPQPIQLYAPEPPSLL